MAKSIFAGINRVKPLVSATYHGRGRYLQRIERIKLEEDRAGVPMFIIEMTVLHVLDNEGSHPTAHRVGETVSFLVKKSNVDYFGREISAFVKNVLEEDLTQMSDEESESIIEAIVADQQPLAGTVVETFGRHKVGDDGQEKCYCSFKREVPASEVAEVLNEHEIGLFFPGGRLEQLIALEKSQA